VSPSLFGDRNLPPGFLYRPEFISEAEEADLLAHCAPLEFTQVEMRGVVAKRRTVHYGFTYRYESRGGEPGVPIPAFLLPLRARVAEWLGTAPDALAEALLTEYSAGAPIGWHRDAPMFGDVAGISLASSSRMKFRRYVSPKDIGVGHPPRRTTHEIELEPRSAYLITGAARRDFEHSIPPVAALRYSVTFRTVRERRQGV
jgi:alkylated DNA repair dioxygenase AlkB